MHLSVYAYYNGTYHKHKEFSITNTRGQAPPPGACLIKYPDGYIEKALRKLTNWHELGMRSGESSKSYPPARLTCLDKLIRGPGLGMGSNAHDCSMQGKPRRLN